MTQAVCFNCGEMKFGAFSPCEGCEGTPRSDDEMVLSLALTDHYFSEETLRLMGRQIKEGNPPHLDEKTRKHLLKSLAEFRETPLGQIFKSSSDDKKH